MVVIALLLTANILTVPLAYASPPDPTWIAGIYDNADYDDVVELVTNGTGASASPVCVRVEQGPPLGILLAEPRPLPHLMPRTQTSRGPPGEAGDACRAVSPST